MTRPGGVRTPVRGQEAGIRDAKPATMVRAPAVAAAGARDG
jgi:hypothetical protein